MLNQCSSHGSVDQALLDEIKNNPHWNEQYIDTCSGDKIGEQGLQCHIYRIFLYTVKVEVRSLEPFLIVRKEFIPTDYTDAFLEEIRKEELAIQTTVNQKTGKNAPSVCRNTNGAFLPHHRYGISSKIFRHIQQRFPSIDFRKAEQFQVLSYNSGGHYAPHFDYLDYASEEVASRCQWYREGGNRLMTFLFIMKTADKGGGTVFPRIATSVLPTKGDAIVWLNMAIAAWRMTDLGGNKGRSQEYCSSFGNYRNCVKDSSYQTAATLWVRIRGNELLLPCATEKQFDIEKLLRSNYYIRGIGNVIMDATLINKILFIILKYK